MKHIQNITSDALQETTVLIDDGTSFRMTLYYRPMQLGWFIENLTYGDFVLNNVRICNSPNILFQFKNIIPFGLACKTEGDREPTLIEDFESGASSLYILNQDEVKAFEDFLSGKI